MRACRHCSHQTPTTWLLLAVRAVAGRGRRSGWQRSGVAPGRRAGGLPADAWRTCPRPAGRITGRATVAVGGRMPAAGGCRRRRAGPARASAGLGESIGYIYVFLRGKLDAGERRRRLVEERAGAEALLAGALNELGHDDPARGHPAPGPDRAAGGDRPGARAARGRGRRHRRLREAADSRGGAADAHRRGGRGRVDAPATRPAATPTRSCAARPTTGRSRRALARVRTSARA